MLSKILSILVDHWVLFLFVAAGFYLIRNKYYNGLSQYPGPWLAAYTNWWRFFKALDRNTQHLHIQLHRQHGDIVRLGPNALSFADPRAIKIIYGLNKGFVKSNFYPIQTAISQGKPLPSMFSTTNEEYHARYKRCVNNAFAMSSLVSYEPLVSSTTEHFLDQTQRFYVDREKSCEFTRWLQFFAFDVIGEITWSKRLGFTERDEDIGGIIGKVGGFLDYAAVIGQIPFLDLVLLKNPLKLLLERWGLSKKVFPVTAFAQARNAERAFEADKEKHPDTPPSPHDEDRPDVGIDLLTKFKQAQADHPDFMSDTQVLASSCSMIFAGSDTTAISLSSVFYHLLTHPRVHAALMAELDDAARDGRIAPRPSRTVSWAESQKLPYLDAVVQEAFRLHPAVGLTLERVVPPAGAEILGRHVPGGTIVGCSPWVLHRRPEVFGHDVDVFRPERWLEASPERLKTMKATMFQFGAGSRTCLGKNISLLEIYKLVPSFLRRFEIELENPDRPWTTRNSWFVKQGNFYTRFRARAD